MTLVRSNDFLDKTQKLDFTKMKPYALQDTVKKIVKYAIENIHDTYI